MRLIGQDSRRGTFSQRHAALIDYDNGAQYVPLASLDSKGFFTVRDSFLSEYAALGFEYGYSVEAQNTLVAWEAQFGDFMNGAEIIIDNFLVAAEDKWGQLASLVMLLPHGYEGQGPEHSSGRTRAIPVTERAQQHPRRPTHDRGAVLPPAALPGPSGAPDAAHRLHAEVDVARRPDALATRGVRARIVPSVLDDHVADPSAVTRASSPRARSPTRRSRRRDEIAATKVAIIRVEQLYPWPRAAIDETLSRYANLEEIIWLQEEPENMGAWPFVHLQMHSQFRGMNVGHVARAESASPATGSSLIHSAEQADLVARALA